jgi:membrane protease subunit HflC
LRLTGAEAVRRYGIRVVDVRIKRLNLPEQNKQSVYARMRAERERIARQYRAEGEEQALAIRAEADRQKEEILSAAYKDAEKIRGEGEAEATRIYSQAYGSISCCERSNLTRRSLTTTRLRFSAPIPSC